MKKNINHIFAVIVTALGLMSTQFAMSQIVSTVSVATQPANLVACNDAVNPYISTLVSVTSNAVLLPGVTWDIYYQWSKEKS